MKKARETSTSEWTLVAELDGGRTDGRSLLRRPSLPVVLSAPLKWVRGRERCCCLEARESDCCTSCCSSLPPPASTTHLIRSAENSQKKPEPTTHCSHTRPLPRSSSLPSVCPSRSASPPPPPPPSFFPAFMRSYCCPPHSFTRVALRKQYFQIQVFCSVLRWTEVQASSGLISPNL